MQNILSSLSLEELTLFKDAVDNNFKVITEHNVIVADYKEVWFDLFKVLVKYVYENYEVLNSTHGFNGLTYGECAKYLITVEISKKTV